MQQEYSEIEAGHARSPWLFVPTLYFLQGLPYNVATALSVAMYKKLGLTNEVITSWVGLLMWAWTLKAIWAPIVDSYATKRGWVVVTQALIIVVMAGLAVGVLSPSFFPITIALLFVMAILSATHDIACDGYYLLACNKSQQAFFVGIRTTAFRAAMIFVTGGLVWIAGMFEEQGIGDRALWSRTLWVGTAVYALFWLWGLFAMPKPLADRRGGVRQEGQKLPFVQALATFFQQPAILAILAFILLYRFSESMVFVISKVFLIDKVAEGGLNLSLKSFAVVNGTVGVVALIIGGIVGGVWIAKAGLKRCIWPMVACMHLPILLYVWAGFAQPQLHHTYQPLHALGIPLHISGELAIYTVVAVDNLGYGFGLAAYMVYLMVVAQRGKYLTSHYAVATGIMALGAMGATMISGFIQKAVGYDWFFVCAFLCALPGTLTLFFIPLDDAGPANTDDKAPAQEADAEAST